MKRALPVVLLVTSLASLSSACAGETQERPAAAPAAPAASAASAAAPAPAPRPLPEDAFRGDEASSRPAPSRFDTRRLGPSEDDAGGETGASRRFRGAPVDLDLKSADLGNVFRLLADVGRVDIVVAGDVTGTVTLRLKHVPWDQALDLVARTHGLELRREGNVVVVSAGAVYGSSTNGAVTTIREP